MTTTLLLLLLVLLLLLLLLLSSTKTHPQTNTTSSAFGQQPVGPERLHDWSHWWNYVDFVVRRGFSFRSTLAGFSAGLIYSTKVSIMKGFESDLVLSLGFTAAVTLALILIRTLILATLL